MIAEPQRLCLANATVQPAGLSDPNFWHAIHFRSGASSRVALDKIEWTSSPATGLRKLRKRGGPAHVVDPVLTQPRRPPSRRAPKLTNNVLNRQ